MSVPANAPVLVDDSVVDRDHLARETPSLDEEKKGGPGIADPVASSASSFTESELFDKYYEPPDAYENKHRWDPKATWTEEEQRKLTRKLDLRVTLVACVCFAALQLDRGNIGQALSDNMLKDLGITTNTYNTGQTIFYLSFLCAELPSQLISKKLGSDVWIPIQMMSWSAVAISQMALNGRTSFYITRCLLGLIEGGFIADTILYLSYYFTKNELTIRLSYFWVSLNATNIVGALLAAGLLKMRGTHGLAGWRWLFGIEGIITFFIGVFAWFYLPAGPTQTAGGIRGKGWFSDKEEIIIVNKVLRDDPTKSDMHNRQGLTFGMIARCITDYDMYPLYLLGLLTFIAPATVAAYFTLTLRSLGFNTFQTNLLSIPATALGIATNLSLGYTSKRVKERLTLASVAAWWQLIFLIVLVTIPDHTNKWAKWSILTLLTAYPYCHPILVSMNSMNAGSVRTRTFASSFYNMFVQASSLVASNIYRADDKPYYHRGNRVLLGIVVADIVMFYLAKTWYVLRNKQRAKVWDSWSLEQKEHYLATTTDQGNKRLDFRFLH